MLSLFRKKVEIKTDFFSNDSFSFFSQGRFPLSICRENESRRVQKVAVKTVRVGNESRGCRQTTSVSDY